MISRILLMVLCSLGLSGCSTYYYDDDRHDRRGYVTRYDGGSHYSARDRHHYRYPDGHINRHFERRYDVHKSYHPQHYRPQPSYRQHPHPQYQGKNAPHRYQAPAKKSSSKIKLQRYYRNDAPHSRHGHPLPRYAPYKRY